MNSGRWRRQTRMQSDVLDEMDQKIKDIAKAFKTLRDEGMFK